MTTNPESVRQRSGARRRRLLAAGAAVALLAAACGGDDEASDTTIAATTVPPEDREPATVTLWSSFTDPETIEKFQPLIDRCQTDNEWLTIEYVAKDDMSTALAAASEANEVPDLVQADFTGGLAKIQATGVISPVDEFIERDGFDWDQFVPGGQKLVTFNGKRWGIPFSVDTVALFYNQDILDEAGLEVPTTWDDLLAAAEALIERDDDGNLTRLGFVPDVGDGSYVTSSALAYGGAAFSDDGTEVLVGDGDAWATMLRDQQKFYDIVGNDDLTEFAAGFGSYDSSENFFITGEVPLYFEGSYFVTWPGRFGEGKPANWGVVPLPAPDGSPEGVSMVASGNSFFIPAEATDREASWVAASCMATAAQEIATLQEFNGNIPSNIAALDIFEADQVAKIPQFQAFVDIARSPDALVQSNGVIAETASDQIVQLALEFRRGNIADEDLESELADLDGRLQDELDLELG